MRRRESRAKSVSLRSTETAPMFFQSLELSRAWNRYDPVSVRAARRARSARAWRVSARRCASAVRPSHVCGARVRCKARRDAAEVGAAEGRARIDRAGQKTRTKRTEPDEADSKFLAGGEHTVVLDIARPQ